MSERFIKFIPSEESDFLAAKHPNAFILLYFIARRARRIGGQPDGLNVGQCHLGDWESLGFSRQNYRTALKVLCAKKFVQILETNRTRKNSTTGLTTEGTLVQLCSKAIWDINAEEANHSPNHCPTTAQPLPNHKQERIRKKKNEEEEKKDIAQTAPQLRKKNDTLFFNFEKWEFTGLSPQDMTQWREMYPHADVAVEMAKAVNWLKSNPSKNNKKLWRKFLTGWFQRANDKNENKKAFGSASGTNKDRRTTDINGNPVESPHTGRF